MSDVIKLLPDAIANQIAAGEVIQRPASVMKELLENAVDAGATSIMIHAKEAGRQLLLVIDNGCGMSSTDARMSLERHATSKIKQSSDLFSIRTMGFRGEALASIAAVAQLELKTRLHTAELGTRLIVEASEIKKNEMCTMNPGTAISVKNLFFNVPARRNFLKNNTVELKHILEEFQRIALAQPAIQFHFSHNDYEIASYAPGNLRQRVAQILGIQSNKKLIPVEEETDIVRISGFVGKPEFAKKTRGEQYLFVNHRFIRSHYLQHAITGAFEDLLPKDTYPLYVLYIDIDPASIDINIHPTKQEIKFENESLIYSYLRVAVRHAIGRYGLSGSLDFEGSALQFSPSAPQYVPDNEIKSQRLNGNSFHTTSGSKQWEKLFEGMKNTTDAEPDFGNYSGPEVVTYQTSGDTPLFDAEENLPLKAPYQIHQRYIVCQIKSGFLLLDQQSAHERILFEQFENAFRDRGISSQRLLFPRQVQYSPADSVILMDLLPEMNKLGFDIEPFGSNSFLINGVPAGLTSSEEASLLEELLEQFKSGTNLRLGTHQKLCRATAKAGAIKRGKMLNQAEMQTLIDELFACKNPFMSPSGNRCFLTYDLSELAESFKQ
jgi:DNA mismatch repair protein MutL